MDGHYRRSKGNAGIEGVQFQVGITTVFLLNALRNLRGWRISTENEDAGKFDDVVVEFSDGSAVLLQAKHKDSKRISQDQLLSTNSRNVDFSLPKYFLSYQEVRSKFNVKNVIICTNADVDKKKLKDILDVRQANHDSILYLEGEDCSFVTFKENILSDLRANSEKYYDINLRSKSMGKEEISDGNLRDFLERLQFFTNYPSGGKLRKAIHDKLLPSLTGSKLWRGTSYNEIYGKVEDWFKRGGGEYLNEILANAMFCEIKSDQFCKILKDYDVSFISTDFGLEEGKSIFHVSVERGYLLQALKMFHALHEQMTALFVNPDDGVEVYKQAVEAFRLPKYKWLILIFHKNINHNLMCEIFLKLKDILDTCTYKKVVLIGNKQNVQHSILKNGLFEIDGSVKFSDLTGTCQEKLVRTENINYQGKRTTLQELLGTSLGEDYDRALNSEGLEKLVRGEEIIVGTSLGSLDPDIVRYYVNRTVEREVHKKGKGILSETRRDRFTEEEIFEVNEQFIIISDCAGMGKSTVLAKLAENVRQKYPHFWIIPIELNEYSKTLRDMRRRRKRTIKITEFLDSNEATRINNSLERFVFSMNKKVVVMFDGFDEISPDYTELVLSLLTQCQQGANFAKVFVTTRPHMNRELGTLLRVKPFLLQPFTANDQIAFISKYWMHHLGLDDSNRDKCEKYAVALINKMSSWLRKNDNFTAIPLHVRMLAEIFQEKWEEKDSVQWEGCKEFLVGAKHEPELPERMNICELYETFIEIKWNILLDKANPTGTASGNDSHQLQSDKCFINHQSLALQEILYNEAIHNKGIWHLFSRFEYDKDMEPRMLKIGIVQTTNGKLEFVHRTFSEYFVAKSILEISELGQGTFNQDVVFQQFFIDEILCNPQFTVVRAFLESALEDVLESLPANILENYQSLAMADPKSQKRRSHLLHLLALEGHVSILKLILKSINIKKNISKNTFKTLMDDENNTLKLLQGLLEKYGIDIEDERGNTLLFCAAEGGHLNMIRYLVGHDANINSRNHRGESAIHIASEIGQLEVFKFLVEKGVDANIHTKSGLRALHWASLGGHLDIVKWIVECGNVDANAACNDGFTALHCAAQGGHLDICKILLEGGVDTNLRNKNGYSALHSATADGHKDVVKWLVQCQNADVNVASNEGSTAFRIAAQKGHLDVCKLLLEEGSDANLQNKNGLSALQSAAKFGHTDIVKWLVESGNADVDLASNDGSTALFFAAEEGHLDVCQLLLEGGADVNLRNKHGNSALHAAAGKGHIDVVKWLVQCGQCVNEANNNGFTAFHWAAQEGHLDICKLLSEGGVDANPRNDNSVNALHLASAKGNTNVVKWLLDCGNVDGSTALRIAAQEGHLDVCKLLLEGGVDVNLCDKKGITALHLAAAMGHTAVVKSLVECGHKDINVTDNNGFTALHWGAQEGHLEVCKLLLEGGVDVNIGRTSALHLAAEKGHSNVVKWLIGCGNAEVNVTNHDGSTALRFAAQEGHLDVCQLLLEGGVDVNLRNKNGHTALHAAAGFGHMDVVKWLVKFGHKDVNVADNNGFTAFHLAVQEGHLDICKLLSEGGVDENCVSALRLASGKGNTDVVKWLLDTGNADVKVVSNDGSTVLHIAAQEGHLGVCKLLLEEGVDANLRDKSGYSVLHAAAARGHTDVVKWLVECGQEDVNVADDEGFTAFHWAVQNCHLDVCKLLLEGSIDVNLRNKNGFTALHSAAKNGYTDVVKWLVERGHADIYVVNNDGSTALHIAAQEGHLEVCKSLVEGGLDINLRNKNGLTVLHLASGRGRTDVVEWLVECGQTDVNVANNDGFTALHCAAQEGYLDVCMLLLEGGIYTNLRNKNGASALHSAARSGHLNVVKWLVECRHADVNEANSNSFTTLHYAAASGQTNVVKWLLKFGHADVNVADNNGFTAFHYAAQEGHLDVCKLLLEEGVDANLSNKNGVNALHLASGRGHTYVVKWLVQYGHENVHLTDNNGFTACHVAALRGQLEVCKFFIEGGLDANLRNRFGQTALHIASGIGHIDIVKWLVQHGHADVNITDNHCSTALHIAASQGHLNVCKFLVNEGVYIHNEKGVSPLHVACFKGHSEVVKWLLKCGHGDVNVTTDDGFGPLHLAAQEGHLEVCKFLIEGGVDINLRNENGFIALHLAIVRSHLDVTKFLVAAGADVNIRSSDGFSALQIATESGHLPIIEFLAGIGRQ